MSRAFSEASTRTGARCRVICPITAHDADTGQVLRVCNWADNVRDGQALVAFLGGLFEQRGATLARRPMLEKRMDGAFFQAVVIGQ